MISVVVIATMSGLRSCGEVTDGVPGARGNLVETVKPLGRLFEKTSPSRQADLVKLVAAFPI
jgi:hypothetical protein